jgi:sulfite exporter TauE/SafE
MIELPLVFLGGLLGSSHCIGMCGGFVLAIGGSAASSRAILSRQLVYSAGRLFTYSLAGALAGFGGFWLSRRLTLLQGAQGLLSVAAGLLLVSQGLLAVGILPARFRATRHTCLTGAAFGTLLTSPHLSTVFVAGLLTGLLPCGLVYAYLALAASTGQMATAATLMAVFGAGTVPIMVLTGCGASLLTLAARRRLLRLAAWCVVLTGLVSLGRGAFGLYHVQTSDKPGACPLCTEPVGVPISR